MIRGWTVALGLLGLVLAVPFSAPDGTGMQWDELVLGGVAGSTVWSVFRLIRRMDASVARPWWVVGVGAALFMTTQLLAGLFPGPAFDGSSGSTTSSSPRGLLLRGHVCAAGPPGPPHPVEALVLDGAIVTVALLVVTEVLRTPLVNPADAPDDLRLLVLTYGAYAAVMLGGAGTLCTVSTAAPRRSATG